jgi:hypothetical protein
MPQFYTLEEAARVIGATPDELKKMAERNEVRAFRDRGTLRFRAPDIEELARRRGRGSDPDLQMGETSTAPSASPPPQKGSGKPPGAPEVFDFSLPTEDSDQVEIGQELRLDQGSSARGGKSGRKPGSGKSPTPKPGSDSDVRLVPDGSNLDFQIASDSDVKMVDEPQAPSAPAATPPKRKTGSSKSRLDSGVQMVPLEGAGDSNVRVPDAGTDSSVSLGKQPKQPKSGSDSDIRLESPPPRSPSKLRGAPPGSGEPMLTEEIDLDAELKAAEARKAKAPPKKRLSKAQPTQPALPTTSPFELSEADVGPPAAPADEAPSVDESSSDFDLTPASAEGLSPLEPSSGEMSPLQADDSDEVNLGELTGGASKSGINLQDPADSGISLEKGGSDEDIEFELSVDEGSTPKPAGAAASSPPVEEEDADASSEFELSLDEEPQAESSSGDDSDSEFELSLDAESDLESGSSPVDDSSPADSDSEFELTLDDSGGLAVDEEAPAEEGEKDIFETDFEVPSLEDESGSQAVALEESDTDLESSDFDLALGDEDVAAEDESGSQVVALEDEAEAEEGAPVLEEGEDVEELFGAEEGAEAEEEGAVAARAAPAPAEWPAWTAVVMLLSVVIMFVGGLMSYELVRRDGTNNPNMVTKAIAQMLSLDKE